MDLINIHKQTFHLAERRGAGPEFRIALIDNEFGTGRTS